MPRVCQEQLIFYLCLFSRKPRVPKMDTEQVKPFSDVVSSCSPDFRNGKLKSCKDRANGESWLHNNKSLCDLTATFLNIHHNFHYAPLLGFLLLLGDDWFCSQKSLHWNWFLWAHNFSSCFHECYEAVSNKWILIINCTEFLDVRGNTFLNESKSSPTQNGVDEFLSELLVNIFQAVQDLFWELIPWLVTFLYTGLENHFRS